MFCNAQATHTLFHSFPESRDVLEIEDVCKPCGDNYVRRPTLHAELISHTELELACQPE